MAHLRTETLIDLANGRIGTATAAVFNAHIARCRDCHAAYLRETSVRRALSTSDVPDVPLDLESRLLSRLADCGMPMAQEAVPCRTKPTDEEPSPSVFEVNPLGAGELLDPRRDVVVLSGMGVAHGQSALAGRRRGNTLVVAAAAAAGLTLAVYGGVSLYNSTHATPIRPPVAQVSVNSEVSGPPSAVMTVPAGIKSFKE